MRTAGSHWTHPAVAAWRNGSQDGAGIGHAMLRPRDADEIDVEALERDLRDALDGEVLFDAGHRAIYSHDSSNYRQTPIGVVLPRAVDDVVAAVAICHEHGAPVLSRGCGTSLAGQTCNVAVVIDHSKHLREILEIDAGRRLARVQPGVVHDQLTNLTEERHELTFAPDTSTHEYATFGGMVGNNSCGTHSVMAGRTADNLEELEVVTYDGLRMRVGATNEDELDSIIRQGGRRGEIYARMRDLRDRHASLIRERYPDLPRRVSGYNLDQLLPENGFNVARALCGSEGTLATVLEATVRLVHSPPARSLLVLGYPDVYHAADHVPEILELGPIGLEGVDDVLVDDMKILGMHTQELDLLPGGKGWLLVEFGAVTIDEADEKARSCMELLRREEDAPSMHLYDDPPRESRLWDVRESGLGATAFHLVESDHWEGWEDAAVPPERLGSYLRGFKGAPRRLRLPDVDVRPLRRRLRALPDRLRPRERRGPASLPRLRRPSGRPCAGARRVALGRARRRPVTRRAVREDVRPGARGRLSRAQGHLGPGWTDEPAQGRRPLSDRLEHEARLGLQPARTPYSLLLSGGRGQLRARGAPLRRRRQVP